jgi:ATP-dependent DNA ligase
MSDLFSSQIPDERTSYLISRDTKGKIRIAIISYELIKEENNRYFIIHRVSGQLGGKRTKQPDIIVDRGKATRNLLEQVDLQFNHLVKEKKDKGYREVTKDPEEYMISELEGILGYIVTNQDNVPKPMLAKQVDKVTNMKIFDKEWYASRKIDGLRCLIYMGDDGNLHTASRGAMNYDAAMSDILEHPDLIQLFKENPGLIMDGECYHHGYSLQQLNSIARTQKTAVDYEVLQFYWYDIVDTNSIFEERWTYMQDLVDALNKTSQFISFDPEREFKDGELRIQFVPQILVSGYDNMIKLHNDYVEDGWEGLVIRDPDKVYRPNGRTNDMIKIKVYRDDLFKVVGYELGLRGSEDMVFICQTEGGKEFKAKPLGDRAQKEEYINNFDSLYKNHIGECKFFYYSDEGTPLQPAFKAFREDIE